MRLFSIRENADGGLNVTTHLANTSDIVGGCRKKIKILKHSIHPSINDPGNQVHLTTIYEDGSKKERYCLTLAVPNRRFQPVYRRQAYRPEPVDLLIPKEGDKVISIGAYDPGRFTLYYALWFAARDMEGTLSPSPFYGARHHNFRKFYMVVAYCFTENPSPIIGHMIEGATYREITAEQGANGIRAGVSEGERPELTPFRITSDFVRLIGAEPLEPPIQPQFLPGLVSFQANAER